MGKSLEESFSYGGNLGGQKKKKKNKKKKKKKKKKRKEKKKVKMNGGNNLSNLSLLIYRMQCNSSLRVVLFLF
jgi:hypothetical protein